MKVVDLVMLAVWIGFVLLVAALAIVAFAISSTSLGWIAGVVAVAGFIILILVGNFVDAHVGTKKISWGVGDGEA